MPALLLKHNPEKTLIEVETPEAEEFGPIEWPGDQMVILADEESPHPPYLMVLEGFEGLKPFTAYRLVEVETVITEEEITEDEDDDDDDDQGDEGEEDEEPVVPIRPLTTLKV